MRISEPEHALALAGGLAVAAFLATFAASNAAESFLPSGPTANATNELTESALKLRMAISANP
jgi:hypothetical protein